MVEFCDAFQWLESAPRIIGAQPSIDLLGTSRSIVEAPDDNYRELQTLRLVNCHDLNHASGWALVVLHVVHAGRFEEVEEGRPETPREEATVPGMKDIKLELNLESLD